MNRDAFLKSRQLPGSPWLLAALVACCLVPRAMMALRLDAICNDAVFYIELARHYELRDVAGGLGRLGLNVYPPILAVLHQLGLDWEAAGKWWGVLVSSLAVLPLYGWVRRQFDERTAFIGASLYAFHPKMIEWSPEVLRDPTFWFLWILGLYAGWRAAEELSLRWYIFAGLAIALAAHTRFEGWLLYLPLVGWTVYGVVRELRPLSHSHIGSSHTNPKRERGGRFLRHRWRFLMLDFLAAPEGRRNLAVGASPRETWRMRPKPRSGGGEFARNSIAATRLWDRLAWVPVGWRPRLNSGRRYAAGSRNAHYQDLCFGLVSPENRVPSWRKAALGVVLCFAILPAFVLLANVTLLRHLPRWELGNFERLGYVAQWWQATRHESEAQAQDWPLPTAPVADLKQPPPAPARMPVAKMFRLFGNAFRRGFGALFGLLWIVGFVVAWKRLLRTDYAILFVVAACIAAAAWIHLWYGQATSSRYFLAIVVLACPCSASGGLWLHDRLIQFFQRLHYGMRKRTAAMGCVMLAIIVGGLAELLADRHNGRLREAALGRWLLAELGPDGQIATFGPMPIIAYYARASASIVSGGDAERREFAANDDVEAFIAIERRDEEASLEVMTARLRQRGYHSVSTDCLPAGHDWSDLVLLTKCPAPATHIQLATGERRSP
jgi:hypothetical protein